MSSTKYDAARLGPIVESSHSLADVIRRLGLQPTGGNYRYIKSRIRRAGLDTSHFGYRTLRRAVDEIPVDVLIDLVRRTTSIAQVLAAVGLPTVGRAHRELTGRILRLGLDTSHHRGSAWSRGETAASHPSVAHVTRRNSLPDDVVFVENSQVINNGPALMKRLLAKGWTYCCAKCGISEWLGKALVLHVDHINGIANDNRLANQRFLCPNCHSQTDTYCNRARSKPSRASEWSGVCYTFRRTRACWNW